MESERRHGRLNDERGSVTVFLVAAVFIVTFVAFAFLIPLGQTIVDRRTASTAADASALAAVGMWRDALRATHADAVDAADDGEFWSVLGRSPGSYRPAGMGDAAADFAARNDSVLMEFSVDARAGEVSVEVRSRQPVPETEQYVYSTATAALVFERGLCLRGGVVGIRVGDGCMATSPPEPSPDTSAAPPPLEAEEELPADPPYEIPAGVDLTFDMSTRLVAN